MNFPHIRQRSCGHLALVVWCLLTAHKVFAEDPPALPIPSTMVRKTLEEIVLEVVQQNPELDFYRAEIAAAQAGRKTASQWENPELGVDVGGKRVWERAGPVLGDGMAWSVSLAQTFEFPGRMALRKAIANRQIDLARLGLEQFQAGLAARARYLGCAVMHAQQKAEVVLEVSGRMQSLLDVLVQRDPAGITPLLDQRIIEASSITLRRRATQAEQEAQSALIELNQLRGQPPSSSLTIIGVSNLNFNLPPLAILTDMARSNNFEMRLRQVELAQQGFRVRLSKHERYPKVTLAPFYAAEEANDEQRIVGVGVSLPVPLWNRNTGNIEAAQARLQQAEASLRATWRQIERRLTAHALALQTQLEEMARWRPDTPQQFREAADLADRHYRLGAVPVATYVEMQLRYLDALDSWLATRGEALEHSQQLELLTGCSLNQQTTPNP